MSPAQAPLCKTTAKSAQAARQLSRRNPAPRWTPPPIMAKRIGAADDPLEREADRAAETVMRGGQIEPMMAPAAPAPQRKCTCEDDEPVRRKCAACERQGTTSPAHADAAAAAVSRGGAPLSPNLRAYFEPRFGRDLSEVRIHTHPAATAAARAIDSRAYTLGSDIAFGAGQYAPATPDGRRLIAHELAHVAQQTPGTIRRAPNDEAGQPKTIDEFRRQHLVANPSVPEPACPPTPTNLGNLTPSPDCNHEGGDLPEGEHFEFCSDSDVFASAAEIRNLRQLVARQPSGSEFQVRTHASLEGPGDAAARDKYNLNLSCHRLNRVIRLLVNSGVQEVDIDGAALGATDRFGATDATSHFNRAAIVHAIPQVHGPRADARNKTPTQIAEAGRKRLTDGDYQLAADAYFSLWTCGRYRTLADAVKRTHVRVARQGTQNGPGSELGTTGSEGPNTIILDADIEQMKDPVECATNRIADLTFHHFVRPVLPGFSDLHLGGTHLIHLAGLGPCVSDLPPNPVQSRPLATDPFAGFRPDCADAPLSGAMARQKGPAKPSTPALFISGTPALSDESGRLVGSASSGATIGVEPDKPFRLDAMVDATGDANTVGGHEIGFIQTVLAEQWVNTHVDGRRELRRLPLPLRDGAARFDIVNGIQTPNPLSMPPWFDADTKVKAHPGLNRIHMVDAPNFRAFRFLPDLKRSGFVERIKPKPGVTLERPQFTPRVGTEVDQKPTTPMKPDDQKAFDEKTKAQAIQRDAELNDAPDTGLRHVQFMTWVVARRIGASATHGETEFLEGVKLDFTLNVDWNRLSSGAIKGNGTYQTISTRAAPSDSDRMLLRGATPQDFLAANGAPEGEPLFAEFLATEGAVPRAQAPGLSQSEFASRVRAIVNLHLPAKGLPQHFEVRVTLDVATGRVVLDTPGLDRGAVGIGPVAGGPPIDPGAATAFAIKIHSQVRKLVLSGPVSGPQPRTSTFTFPIII